MCNRKQMFFGRRIWTSQDRRVGVVIVIIVQTVKPLAGEIQRVFIVVRGFVIRGGYGVRLRHLPGVPVAIVGQITDAVAT